MKKPDAQTRKKLRFEQARQLYLDKTSPSFYNAHKSLILAGYTENSARSLAHTLWSVDTKDRSPSVKDILPKDVKSAADEIRSWFSLMTKWREAIKDVEDPLKLGSRTFSVISAHIERLCKIFGFLVETTKMPELNVTLNFATMPSSQQYSEVKSMLLFLIERVHSLEDELHVPIENRFSLS